MNLTVSSTTGLCPKCQTVRNLGVNIEHRNGAEKIVETATAHCQTCGSFVWRNVSEVTEEAA